MNHQAFLQSLSPDTRAALTARSDAAGLLHLAGHVALIGVLAMGVLFGGALWWLFLLPLGIATQFLFCLLHEVSHDTVFATKRLNTGVAWVAGLVLILPPLWFRYFHFAHHKHTHDPALDPELATPKPNSWASYAWYLTGVPVWRSSLATLMRNARGACKDPYVPVRKRLAVMREARVMLAIYAAAGLASVMLGSALMLWLWIVPLLLGQPFLRLYLLAEHTLCPHSDDMFSNTRTTFTTRVVRFLAWNMPYHAEHHTFPMVPFHKLPDLHRLTAAHLRTTAQGYHAFHAQYQRAISN